VRQLESSASDGDRVFAMSIPPFLAVWLVCAILAGISWENLVANTPTSGAPLTIGFPALIVLSVSFGLPGAGLAAFAWGIMHNR
jgi:hypothetical protein